MPNDKSNKHSVQLNVEMLEARTVPASFGANQGLSVARGDVMNLGVNQYITGSGPGTKAIVRVYDLAGNIQISFNPFGNYTGGVFVDRGDIDGNGTTELIVSTGGGTTGRVKVYEFVNARFQVFANFIPFGPNYSGPVQIAVANVAGDSVKEIITGQGSGGSTVKVFSYSATATPPQFFAIRKFQAFPTTYNGGVSIAAANLDNTTNTPGDPYDYDYAEIVVGKASYQPIIRTFDAQLPTVTMRNAFFAFPQNSAANAQGVNVAAGDTDGVRGAEIYVALKGGSNISFFNGQSYLKIGQVRPYPAIFTQMVNIYVDNTDDDINGIYNVSDLIVVKADGSYFQAPLLYPGLLDSPAGLNGSMLA